MRNFRGQLRHLLADTVVATALVVLHAIIIMCQVTAVRAPHPAALAPPTRSPMRYTMLCTCAVIQHTIFFRSSRCWLPTVSRCADEMRHRLSMREG